MAYLAEYLVQRLSVHSAWRKPEGKGKEAFKSADHLYGQWVMAWGKLDVCILGISAWNISGTGESAAACSEKD